MKRALLLILTMPVWLICSAITGLLFCYLWASKRIRPGQISLLRLASVLFVAGLLSGCVTMDNLSLKGREWWDDYGRDLLDGREWPDDDIVTPPAPEPLPDGTAFDYRGRSWWDKAAIRGMNILDLGMPDSLREQIIQWRAGDNIAAVFLYNDGDGAYGRTSFYKGTFAGEVDPGKVAAMRAILQRQKAVSGRLDLWLEPDDSPSINRASLEQLYEYYGHAVEHFGDLADMWCVCLECDESHSAGEVKALVEYLKGLTDKPVFVHYTRTKASESLKAGSDGLHGQTPPSASPVAVGADTARAVGVLHPAGKYFVQWEHGHSNAKGAETGTADAARGAAALANGADGTGSGR